MFILHDLALPHALTTFLAGIKIPRSVDNEPLMHDNKQRKMCLCVGNFSFKTALSICYSVNMKFAYYAL